MQTETVTSMKTRVLLASLLALSTSAPLSAAVAAEVVENNLIRFVLPEGFVRLKPGGVVWAPADNASAQRCTVALTNVEFDSDPTRSFERGWKNLNFTQKYRIAPPTPVITKLHGNYTVGGGVWTGSLPNGSPYTFAVGNVSRAAAGYLLVGHGTDPGCAKKFEAMLHTIEIVDPEVPMRPGPGPQGTAQAMGDFYREANLAEQRRTNQRTLDQQSQDRLAQQRELDRQSQSRMQQQQEQARQAQSRMMQQQEQSRQAQQRIQDSYRR